MLKPGSKILFISNNGGFFGGTESYIYDTASLLKKNGFRPYFLYFGKTYESDRFFSVFEQHWSLDEIGQLSEDDFELTTLHKTYTPQILEVILKHFSPTVFVHDHAFYCPKRYKYFPYKRLNCTRAYHPLFCPLCASIVPPRHITNGIAGLLKKNFVDSKKLFRQAISCRKFVVLTDFMKQNLVRNGFPADRIQIVHPFLREFPEIPTDLDADITQIVFAGQMVMSKGIPLLLKAISKLRSLTQKPFLVKILGTGARIEDFKKMSDEMGLSSVVEYLGWLPHPGDIFARSHIGVFPSLWQEPFGLSGIEEMSYGLPVVGFDVGGVSEWLHHNENGLLIPERDTDAMAKALATLIEDKTLRQTLGMNARKGVLEQYSGQKYLENFIRLA